MDCGVDAVVEDQDVSEPPPDATAKRQLLEELLEADEVPPFIHQPLSRARKSIRVFEVLDDPDVVQCKVWETFLRSDYTAVSYMWGPSFPTKSILINGLCYKVGANLWAFLDEVRRRKDTCTFWVDAICIDQQNIEEKSYQVQFMGEIYSQAVRVILWLGRSYKQMDEFLVRVSKLSDSSSSTAEVRNILSDTEQALLKRQDTEYGDTVSNLLLKLICNSYWARTWVVQEITLSDERFRQVLYGSNSLPWASLSTLVGYCNGPNDLWLPASGIRHDQLEQLQSSFLARYCKDSRNLMTLTKPKQMRTLLQNFGETLCSDVRDRIFALRMIVNDPEFVEVDYRMTPQIVFFSSLSRFLTFWQIDKERHLRVLTSLELPRLFYQALQLKHHDIKAIPKRALKAWPELLGHLRHSLTLGLQEAEFSHGSRQEKLKLCRCSKCDLASMSGSSVVLKSFVFEDHDKRIGHNPYLVCLSSSTGAASRMSGSFRKTEYHLGLVLPLARTKNSRFRLVIKLPVPDGGRILKLPDGGIIIVVRLPALATLIRAMDEALIEEHHQNHTSKDSSGIPTALDLSYLAEAHPWQGDPAVAQSEQPHLVDLAAFTANERYQMTYHAGYEPPGLLLRTPSPQVYQGATDGRSTLVPANGSTSPPGSSITDQSQTRSYLIPTVTSPDRQGRIDSSDGQEVTETAELSNDSYQCDWDGCTAAPGPTQHLLNSHVNLHSETGPHLCPVGNCPRSAVGQGFKRKNEMIRYVLPQELCYTTR